MTESKSLFKVSDWVKGHSINDELFCGFVKKVNDNLNTVKVFVTESDNKYTIGRTIETFQNKVKFFHTTEMDKKRDLLNLIDLALQTEDKEWFLHLTDELNHLSVLQENEEKCIAS